MLTSLRHTIARVGRWPRLAAAGICLLLAGASALQAHARGPARPALGIPVVVAARDLPAGHRLVRADLVVTRWPPATAPPGARASPGAMLGATLAGPIGRREAVTPTRLVGPALINALPAGTVATVVAVDHDAGAFVHPGERVDLLASARDDLLPADGTSAAPNAVDVAAGVLVLAATPLAPADVATSLPGVSLVLAVDRAVALRIARLRSVWSFSVVADSP